MYQRSNRNVTREDYALLSILQPLLPLIQLSSEYYSSLTGWYRAHVARPFLVHVNHFVRETSQKSNLTWLLMLVCFREVSLESIGTL